MSTATVPDDVRVADRLVARWPVARPFLLIGSAAIVAGGIVAAVAHPAGFGQGSWLAAFLVLVGGVGQVILGGGQAWMAAEAPAPTAVTVEVAAWNLGVAATVVGTLAAVPLITAMGGVAIVAGLVLFLRGVRRSDAGPRWTLVAYRGLVTLVLISTPVGLALAWARHG